MSRRFVQAGLGLAAATLMFRPAAAQNCTTQAKMLANQRQMLADATLQLANAVKSDDAGSVGKMADTDIAANFAPTGFLIRNLSEVIGGDTVQVTQLYQLDANAHVAGQGAPADFSCPLATGASEVDFSIQGLPPGLYAFTMAEASGPRPWMLSFLLHQQGGQWKMAGFYPHTRAAAGHDGLWFWNEARTQAKAGHSWSAWLRYGTADLLLRPANFVTTTHLDKLRSERSAAAPPELRDGLTAETPLVIKTPAAAGAKPGATTLDTAAITGLTAEGSEDGKRLNLVIHYRGDAPAGDSAAARARNQAVAQALLAAHPELRNGFDSVLVFADTTGGQPFATEFPSAQL